MRHESIWLDLALGAAAGLAGTMALQALHTAGQKWLPESAPPIQDDPGKFMTQKASSLLPDKVRARVPEFQDLISKILGLGYGATFGILYVGARRRKRTVTREGLLLGLACWAAGYLGWLPATKLMPPVWRHKPKQIAAPLAEHALYGLATTAGLRLLQKLV